MFPFNRLIIRSKFVLNLCGFIVKLNTMLVLLTGLDTATQAGWEMLVKDNSWPRLMQSSVYGGKDQADTLLCCGLSASLTMITKLRIKIISRVFCQNIIW